MFILFDMYHPYYSLSYVARSYISKIDREILGFRNINVCKHFLQPLIIHGAN